MPTPVPDFTPLRGRPPLPPARVKHKTPAGYLWHRYWTRTNPGDSAYVDTTACGCAAAWAAYVDDNRVRRQAHRDRLRKALSAVTARPGSEEWIRPPTDKELDAAVRVLRIFEQSTKEHVL